MTHAIPIHIHWESTFPKPNLTQLKKFCQDAIQTAHLPIKPNQCLDITFLDSEAMDELNNKALHHKGDTDVITFDLRDEAFPFDFDEEESSPLGELYICPPVALRQAQNRIAPTTTHARRLRYYSREIALYIIHGILHLRGEDDLSPEPRKKMRHAEQVTMNELETRWNFLTLFPPPKMSAKTKARIS